MWQVVEEFDQHMKPVVYSNWALVEEACAYQAYLWLEYRIFAVLVPVRDSELPNLQAPPSEAEIRKFEDWAHAQYG